MTILFICSGNSGGVSPIVKNQGDSLVIRGHRVDYFTIKGKGMVGYLQNVMKLNIYLKNNQYDIIHSHYSLSSFVASLAGAKRLQVSLMGSDVKSSRYYKILIKIFAFLYSWENIIVKSPDMYRDLGIKRAIVLPNGVCLKRFNILDKTECQKHLEWDISKRHILFTSNPKRVEKNFDLAIESVSYLNDSTVELHYMTNVPNHETPIWYNAADVVLLTSFWEGSPNAIKEAMACNRPIVTTDVGDVKWVISDTEGCYIASSEVIDCAEKIKKAIKFSEVQRHTNGRERIIQLGLDNKKVAETIVCIYKKIKHQK